MPLKKFKPGSVSGFTLIEILVAAVVLGIGILGLATLMLTSLKSDQSAFYRSIASTLAYDMADRIRKNNVQATAGSYDGVDTSATMPSNPACISSSAGCTQNQLVAYDIREWAHNFVNVSGASNYVSALPNGVGRVRRGVGNLFTITVSWNETDWDNANPNQRVATTETLSLNMSL